MSPPYAHTIQCPLKRPESRECLRIAVSTNITSQAKEDASTSEPHPASLRTPATIGLSPVFCGTADMLDLPMGTPLHWGGWLAAGY